MDLLSLFWAQMGTPASGRPYGVGQLVAYEQSLND